MDVIWLIITTVIGGAIIGMLGKMVAPGDRDKIPFWLTVVCGIVGMLAGSYLYWVLFGDNNRSFDGHQAEPDNATNGIEGAPTDRQAGRRGAAARTRQRARPYIPRVVVPCQLASKGIDTRRAADAGAGDRCAKIGAKGSPLGDFARLSGRG